MYDVDEIWRIVTQTEEYNLQNGTQDIRLVYELVSGVSENHVDKDIEQYHAMADIVNGCEWELRADSLNDALQSFSSQWKKITDENVKFEKLWSFWRIENNIYCKLLKLNIGEMGSSYVTYTSNAIFPLIAAAGIDAETAYIHTHPIGLAMMYAEEGGWFGADIPFSFFTTKFWGYYYLSTNGLFSVVMDNGGFYKITEIVGDDENRKNALTIAREGYGNFIDGALL